MQDALILLAVYIVFVLVVLLKPLIKYLIGLRGVKVTCVNIAGESKTKVIYFSQDDPLYIDLKNNRGV
ncbi:conserved hypothetical protein [Vibrio chagasii]|uniref:hypothetical protein n=1 Tax=Vibrio chagasii TaxID=170679 RepID=UPI0033833603|nr:conserved hypothetical protein [Vibrio chagasii]CAH7075378.1 conserved hypothetical protein [Vibrio chagasii]CAH7167492.1 conserved hypothetical protein [Vibrio chagasii]CAH7198100.1 conserved hypothetical protein [Vibrio chagasii]CAH7199402.1 conserved hypothetical protein [Vibrio chagasii]